MSIQITRPRSSIATVSLSGSLRDKLEAAASVGFDGVEIFENDLLTFEGSPADVRRICADLGLGIEIFQPFRDFEAMPEAVRRRNLDRAERKFDVMQALGTDLVLVCSNVQAACDADPARAAADLREMAERAAARGLRVGYEALAWGRHTRTWRQAWDIVQRADHPALGLIVDSFHTLALGDDPTGISQVPAEKLFFVQLADAPKLSLDVLSWSRHYRNFPGQGQLDVAGFVREVMEGGYTGPLSLEVFNDDFRAAPARPTARDALRSLAWVADAAGVAALPPLPVFDGVEFLEFAVDEGSRDELAGFLTRLGFVKAGRHRSKDVDLYRQGRINLVLNAEQDSAAGWHFQLHGPSVCAIALRVDSTTRALERARALYCQEWQEPAGTGERPLPGLHTPDGTLVLLVEPGEGGRTIYDDDFELSGTAEGAVDLTSIDHVAQALPAGRMDGFVLFWRAVFGFEPEPVWEIPDPYGLIRSRAMVSRDGTVRLPLNISESRETATGRFVSASAGAGVQHIAFACANIAASVAQISAHGATILPIPENYYDDLAARHGLDDTVLAGLQAQNLLYDADDAGVFMHAFTETYADRFFFEIVERDGYRGFGAVNAGVRLAVQAQRRGNPSGGEAL